ncbi:N-acetylglucosamine-6-phosphate deacetylase [Oscillospiraceae bacterium PP1C4]
MRNLKTLIKNARIVGKDYIFNGCILMKNGVIAQVCEAPQLLIQEDTQVIDAQGNYVCAGFIDIHTHGAGGSDYMDGTVHCMIEASKMHLRHGTTSIYPTTLTSTMEELFQTLDNFQQAKQAMRGECNLLGLHLEGPYFSMEQRGAQDPRYIKNPDENEYRRIVEYAGDSIARWSVAPELLGAIQMGDYLVKNNILPSIGHSNAEYSDVLHAYHHGYTHVTHLYSGMSTITRKGGFRHLGVIESAYAIEDLTVEIIADGCHLPPELLRMVYRFKGADKVCLVTDSMRCAGQATAKSIVGSLSNGQEVLIEDGVAKLMDRSAFASSIATADRLVRVMYKEAKVDLCDCITMMTLTPAKVMNIDAQKGSIACGKDADIVIFDENIEVKKVIVGGKIVSDSSDDLDS